MIYLCLDLHGFVFLFLLFQVEHLIIITCGPLITSCVPPCSTLGLHQPSSYHNSWQRLVLGFNQLSKTKLGFSISPFLVIYDNLFTKIFNKIFLDSCFLPKHITMFKDYGQVSSIQIGIISSPYVLRVWIWKLAHMYGLKVWESNSYQMMLRCKEWTFEAWYQSKLLFEHYP
jgi:hypothetical protein